jgi:hypothetical protein
MASQLSAGSSLLLLAAACSGAAAVAHVGVVVGGPTWYRLFGAGEGMARVAAGGSWYPALITIGIASVLAGWSAYAASAAGLLPPLPFLRTALLGITAVYMLRGIGGLFLAAFAPGGNSPAFWAWSSVICLFIGIVHAAGLSQRWGLLSASHN